MYADSGFVLITTEPISETLSIDLDPFTFNNISFNVMANNMSFGSIVSNLDMLLAVDGNSNFFVPEFNIDQIGEVDLIDGFKVFVNGQSTQTLIIEGAPIDVSDYAISLEAFTMNLISYLPSDCMAPSVAFSGYENNLLIVKSSDGVYIPSFNVETLTEMCPGEAYAVFLNGADGLDYTYPTGTALSSNHSDYFVEDYISRTRTNDVPLTGESHLILLSQIDGKVDTGDQLRAYANGKLVGSINIVEEHLNGTHPVDLAAVGSVDMSNYGGPVLAGYDSGDMIELRLWSMERGVELKVESSLSDIQYGNVMELSTGSATVLDEGAIVTSLELTQNYPNPFNPSTTISYNVDTSGMVSLQVYDIMGRLVRTLVDGHRSSGNLGGYSVVWDGKDSQGQQVSAGLYIYSLQTPNGNMTKKMVLMK